MNRNRDFRIVLQSAAVTASAVAAAAFGGDLGCIPDNPSFEIGPGEGGEPIAAWSDDGAVGRSPGLRSHGSWAAWIAGPSTGGPGISRLIETVDCLPGWRHRFVVDVGHRGADPVVGAARLAFIATWLDSSGNVLDVSSRILLNQDSPTDEMFTVEELLPVAPSGTDRVRLEFAFIQTKTQEPGRAYVDAFQFMRVNPGVNQWGDFSGTILEFSGRIWRVKSAYTGPGPNAFSPSPNNATVRPDGSLRLAINKVGDQWRCSEVTVEDVLGYGTYRFKTRGRVDLLDPNTVFGLFLWEYPQCFEGSDEWWNPASEFDIEFSRWGQPGNDFAQFVAQPYWWGGNISRFAMPEPTPAEVTSEFNWTPDGVICRAWLGHADEPSSEDLLHEWTYTGPHQPRPGLARVHLNLWLVNGSPPMNGQEQSIEITSFDFIPEPQADCTGDLNGDGVVDGADLGLLIGGWGTSGLGDLNGDASIDGADLGLMIGAWGVCPG